MQTEKLKNLADELASGDLAFDEFHFDRYTGKLKCGTVGCALGHYAMRSPDWDIVDDMPVWNERETKPYISPILDAKEYFQIPHVVSFLLFNPSDSSEESLSGFSNEEIKEWTDRGLKKLSAKATAQDVAGNIYKLLEHYEED